MPVDFENAAKRHLHDGELLHNAGRNENADQMFGFAAECGLKAALKGLGKLALDRNGRPTSQNLRVHLPQIWMEFIAAMSGRQDARYIAMLAIVNPFQDWSVSHRYEQDGMPGLAAKVQAHRTATIAVERMLDTMRIDGVLT